MEKENWIDEVISNTDKIAKAVPNDALFFKIQNRIKKAETVSPEWIWIAAASLLLLASLNVKFVFSKSHKEKSPVERIASYVSTSNQLY